MISEDLLPIIRLLISHNSKRTYSSTKGALMTLPRFFRDYPMNMFNPYQYIQICIAMYIPVNTKDL